MKKFIATILSTALLFSACAPGGTASTSVSADASEEVTASEETETNTEANSGENIALSYLAWNLGTAEENNIERRMLAKFVENNPNVDLIVMEVPLKADGKAGDYGDYMRTLASKQQVPDVFMWASATEAVANGWAGNVSEYADKDSNYANVVEAIREGGKIGSNVYAIPYAMHIFGMAQNNNIFDELNVDPLEYNYTLDELLEKIEATSTNKYKGIENFGIEDWGSFTLNDKIGFGTFDGEKYNFSSPEFARSIEIYSEVVAKGYIGNPSFIEPTTWLPEGVTASWPAGYIGLQYEASWFLQGVINGEVPFKSDLLPLPNEKVVLVPDYIFVSETSAQAEAAYELAKWMSYSTDGMKTRIAIREQEGIVGYSGLPLNAGADQEIDDYFLADYKENFPNFNMMYDSLKEKPENVIVEGFKIVPGYAFSRFDADTGVTGVVDGAETSLTMSQLVVSIIRGDKKLADYAVEMDKIANQRYQEAVAALEGR